MVIPPDNQQFPELEQLVSSIKQGQRVVLFPPGIASFITVIMLLMVSFVTLTSPLLNLAGEGLEISQQATAQLLFIMIATISIVLPALLITRGRKRLQRWFIFLASFLAFSAAVLVAIGYLLNVESLVFQSPLLLICIFTSSLAAFLANTISYRTCVYFYFLMHQK